MEVKYWPPVPRSAAVPADDTEWNAIGKLCLTEHIFEEIADGDIPRDENGERLVVGAFWGAKIAVP